MAFSTELVVPSNPAVRTQTTTTASTTHTLPAGTWLCTLTGTLSAPAVSGATTWIELDGVKASADATAGGSGSVNANLGVVLPSVAGGRSITIKASTSTSLSFRAVRIG